MNRRHLMLLLAVVMAVPLPSGAQQNPLPIVGVMRINTADNVEPFPTVFRNALAALGKVEGRDIRIDLRLANGDAERFPELAQALVREKASVIVASGDAAVRAAQQATTTIPIIGIVDDIVGAGLINSLAKPGGNATGVSILAAELDAKRLEILKQFVPTGRRFGVLRDPASATAQSAQLADAARDLGVELGMFDVRASADFDRAFHSLHGSGTEAVVMRSSPLIFGFREELCGLSLKNKLPAITQTREMAAAGCLASYGIRISEAYEIAAALTDKMLNGARAADTPAQQPNHVEFVINLKTAKLLGVPVSPLLLSQADEVIE